jgi:hypothetical protein
MLKPTSTNFHIVFCLYRLKVNYKTVFGQIKILAESNDKKIFILVQAVVFFQCQPFSRFLTALA